MVLVRLDDSSPVPRLLLIANEIDAGGDCGLPATGEAVGDLDGLKVGDLDGIGVGDLDGIGVGDFVVGAIVGFGDGVNVWAKVGAAE